MKKKILSVILAAALTCSMVEVVVQAKKQQKMTKQLHLVVMDSM